MCSFLKVAVTYAQSCRPVAAERTAFSTLEQPRTAFYMDHCKTRWPLSFTLVASAFNCLRFACRIYFWSDFSCFFVCNLDKEDVTFATLVIIIGRTAGRTFPLGGSMTGERISGGSHDRGRGECPTFSTVYRSQRSKSYR